MIAKFEATSNGSSPQHQDPSGVKDVRDPHPFDNLTDEEVKEMAKYYSRQPEIWDHYLPHEFC